MTHSCRICSKLMCPDRGDIEGCKDCVSYLWLAMQEIDKKLKWEDKEDYDRLFTDTKNR